MHDAIPPSRRGERVATAAVWASALLVAGGGLWVLADLVWHGVAEVTWGFLTQAPRDGGRAGGILPILVSTALILATCLAIATPIALGAALWLAELRRGSGRFVRRSLDVLAGVPSIVFGLFGNALFCHVLGLGFSILSGGLTLACMVLPLLIRTTEQGLRAVPDDHRRAAAALGLSRTTTVAQVLLPMAVPGLIAGLVLGIGRAMAETAALLFTSGYVDRMPGSLLDSGRALSVHIYDLAMNVLGGAPHAYGSAVVLVAVLIVVNQVGSWLARRLLQQGLLAQ